MFEANIALFVLGMLLVFVFSGIHIAVVLGITSAIGVYMVTGNYKVVEALVQNTYYDAIRDYVFAVIPLFMLMGEFVGRSGMTSDLYRALQRSFSRVPGRLALATLLGNAIFAFVTGVSIASAAAFTRIAYPEMVRHNYDKGYALGSIAGSGVLGMLIPPSVLMIIWGILTEQSIGDLFLAGVIPGFLLVTLFAIYIIGMALLRPELAGAGPADARAAGADVARAPVADGDDGYDSGSTIMSAVGLIVLVGTVLGGMWGGLFTPTEAAGMGALMALVLALLKGVPLSSIYQGILQVGRTAAPILALLLAAALYSRTLTMTGVVSAIQDFFAGAGLDNWEIILVMTIVWFVLGMIIDSASIMLLTVPIFWPIALTIGIDPIAFALIGILTIEAGILTPPFGLLVYTVKAAVPRDDPVSLLAIFGGSTPYWFMILILIVAIYLIPEIASYLPNTVLR
ncbi:MAG: TRAP transporter large permease [Alphaproteobacteria bacterium]